MVCTKGYLDSSGLKPKLNRVGHTKRQELVEEN